MSHHNEIAIIVAVRELEVARIGDGRRRRSGIFGRSGSREEGVRGEFAGDNVGEELVRVVASLESVSRPSRSDEFEEIGSIIDNLRRGSSTDTRSSRSTSRSSYIRSSVVVDD